MENINFVNGKIAFNVLLHSSYEKNVLKNISPQNYIN